MSETKISFYLLVAVAVILVSNVIDAKSKNDNYIIGGQTATPGQFPFIVSLRGGPLRHPYCHGCIISNRWILTTTTCVRHHINIPKSVAAYVGAHNRTDGVAYELDRIILHPEFSLRPGISNDIAVMRTAITIEFVAGLVQPARLPSIDYTESGQTAIRVAGWGLKRRTQVSSNQTKPFTMLFI